MEVVVALVVMVLIGWGLVRILRGIRVVANPDASHARSVTPPSPPQEAGSRNDVRTPLMTVSVSTSFDRQMELGELTERSSDRWLVNPQGTFPVTLAGVDRAKATDIWSLLQRGISEGSWKVRAELTAMIARTNVRFEELDAWMAEWKPIYLAEIQRLIATHPDWNNSSEKDRDDLMTGFKQQALATLRVRPHADLPILLEGEPTDMTMDDKLLEFFGADLVQLYMRHADQPEKLRSIPADHRDRGRWDALVTAKLARSGNDLPVDGIAETLKVKELNALLADTAAKPHSRKAAAVAAVAALPDARARMGRVVAFRELFQLLPLPDRFKGIDLKVVSQSWRFASEVTDVMLQTLSQGLISAAEIRSARDMRASYAGWTIASYQPHGCCPECDAVSKRKHPVSKPPRVPVHVGCVCRLDPVWKEN